MSLLKALAQTLRFGGKEKQMMAKNVIFITGCDSGLGYTLALFCHSLNMTVAAACHNTQSQGACCLRKVGVDAGRMHVLELDLCEPHSVAQARDQLQDLLSQPTMDFELTALVNNAGVMCFGEFEWQTSQQCAQQIDVNVLGTWRVTKELLPLVRRHHARIINITSNCALRALPAVAPYAASKAALRYWNDALRIEMAQYGVTVINFVPGSFVMSSNIAARQQQHAAEQLEALSPEQRDFYGAYGQRFHDYLRSISGFKAPQALQDKQLLQKFRHALTHTQPRPLYLHEPWRYKFYRLLSGICPTPIADWLMVQFCAMPTYAQVTSAAKNK